MDQEKNKSPKMRDSQSREKSVPSDVDDSPEISSDENEDYDDSPYEGQFDYEGKFSSRKESSIPSLYPKLPKDMEDLRYSPKTIFTTSSSSVNKSSSSFNSTVIESENVDSNRRRHRLYPTLKQDDKSPKRAKTKKSTSKKNETNSMNYLFYISGLFVLLLCVGLYFWPDVTEDPNSPVLPFKSLTQEDRFKIFRNDLRGIKDKFPNQDGRAWSDILAGIHNIMNSSKPWTFVLFSNESEQITCLADLLGIASSKALLSENKLTLNPKDFGNEYGDTIDRLRPQIKERKAVVVHDLLSIDPGAIQVFHTMCDRYNPLVEGAVYILTLIAPGYNPSQRPEVFVEDQLTNKFINRIPEDKLQPLITRITDGPIIRVVPEKTLTGCPLL